MTARLDLTDLLDAIRQIVREELELAKHSGVMTTREACAYLRCSRSKLHELVRSGAVVVVRHGSSVRYERTVLDEYLARGGEAPGAQGDANRRSE